MTIQEKAQAYCDQNRTTRSEYIAFVDGHLAAKEQAQERHANELQELKDKAIEAFAAVCKSNLGNDCERCAHGVDGDCCRVLELFTQKLNEK